MKILELTREPKALTKKERRALKHLLKDDLDFLHSVLHFNDFHENIKELHKDVYGTSMEDEFNEELEMFKRELKEAGVDIDLSHIQPGDSLEDMFIKYGEAMREKFPDGFKAQDEPLAKPKTKKELLKEQKAVQLKELQSKGIGIVYKRLVKEFHPDLEQDPAKRMEKELLMKKITVAYEERDFVELLALESEWLDQDIVSLNDETIKIYNSLLKDQIADLETQRALVIMNPRYLQLHFYIKNDQEGPLEVIQRVKEELKESIKFYKTRMKDLSTEKPIKLLKKILAQYDEEVKFSLSMDEVEIFFKNGFNAR